jgi:hypothetical protein
MYDCELRQDGSIDTLSTPLFSGWTIPLTTMFHHGPSIYVHCTVGYNEFDFFLENKEYRPFDGCKIEI